MDYGHNLFLAHGAGLLKDLSKGASLPNRAHLPLSHHTSQAVSPIWPAEFQMASKWWLGIATCQ